MLRNSKAPNAPNPTTSHRTTAKPLQPLKAATDSASARASVCVVGAGPAGLLTGIALAKRGLNVQVFESRELESITQPTSRSFALWVTGRSQNAFKDLGVNLPVLFGPNRVPMKELLYNQWRVPVHVVMGFADKSKATYCVERHRLVSELKAIADDLPSGCGSIDWHFGYELAELDLNNRVAKFEPIGTRSVSTQGSRGTSVKSTTMQYDLIVGADGANSAVRRNLEKEVPGFKTKVLYNSVDTWWKSFSGIDLSPWQGTDEQRPGLVSDKPLEAMYSFQGKTYAPGRPNPAFSCWKSLDGRFAGAMVLMPRFDESFLRDQVSTAFPGAPESVLGAIVEQLKDGGDKKANKSNTVVQVSQMHGPRCVILGDAAHSVTSTLGQGLNSALESVRVLAQTYDKVPDLDALPAAFNQRRLRDAHALQTLELLQLMAMRPLDFPHTSPIMLALSKAVLSIGHAATKLFGKGSPAMLQTTIMTRMASKDDPYSNVLKEFMLDAGTLAGAAAASLALLLWGARVAATGLLFA